MPSHIPVLSSEVVNLLQLKAGDVAVDATLGGGGHTLAMLKAVGPKGKIIGIDKDAESITRLRQNSSRQQSNGQLVAIHGSYADVGAIIEGCGYQRVDAILFDLGLSTVQLALARGFSFLESAPLDMRFDRSCGVTAEDVVNGYSREELADILRRFGQEPAAPQIAKAIFEARRRKRITDARELAEIVSRAKGGRRGRIHPATLTFQALRIEVNGELAALKEALPQALAVLKPSGRVAIISYHSLEDKLVKEFFREAARMGKAKLITKKALQPDYGEIRSNPRARSAKLRVLEKV
ncbi:16S rRNA (cytosine(1402)-N(4))-methyltransferase [candidate division Kazan bacterium RBG_13_50_9]|uniref:Ribosomal RNA small subunit methyltransferase H n=1 Tax=candidate division Kazan bacterium RBG_13_50_9 TaxID=1798535 RepID=A0A1F4NRR3_UNCK3|nr:MAG: 16S rRNA (cytosine(1402)-N(4))-methyltransferase [candidate division Kazan bacterium RBG_13_50_9]